MNTAQKKTCRQCGAEIPATNTDGLCPACLMSAALRTSVTASTMPTAPGSPVVSAVATVEALPCDFGDYRLSRLLGCGGMGAVYEAEQLATGRRVALKMIGRQLDSPEMRHRFLREGRLAARVNHPNSLYVFGSEEIDGRPVITMEIAGGGTLKDELKRHGPLPIARAVDNTLDVIAGLESALACGVLHRDIKPSNCFLNPDGSVKVGDFGLSVSTLAKHDTLLTAHGKIMGTPAYASPEQLRGDALDFRADMYSVGATLFTLLTNRAPFEGDNAVQVVANAVNQPPPPVTDIRQDVPAALARVVSRCLAKNPDDRYPDYTALCNALLPFGSREPEPASLGVRAAAGWIDFLIAFLPPYVALMLLVGAEKLLVLPLVDRTLYAARYYLLLMAFGFLYFTIVEGIWGAGLGKRLKGLRAIRPNGRPPGLFRALVRIAVPILCCEGVRLPLMLALIHDAEWTGLQTAIFVLAAVACAWIPAAMSFLARPSNGFATIWDYASGTRVIVRPTGPERVPLAISHEPTIPNESARSIGPYRITKDVVPDSWILATDPVLSRRVWLMRRSSEAPSEPRRDVARPGRPRWLQHVTADGHEWDAFEAPEGMPLPALLADRKPVAWAIMRHWLHDLASELWHAKDDHTLPDELSLDQVWITTDGRAMLLDGPWPDAHTGADRFPVASLSDQQRFLHALAAHVDATSMPLHARPLLRNLEQGKFEKLSFLAGTLRGHLENPAVVSRGLRAGSLFILPLYIWIAVFLGLYSGTPGASIDCIAAWTTICVFGAIALVQLLSILFRTTPSQATFRLAVVNARGERAGGLQLIARWTVVWLPILIPLVLAAWMHPCKDTAAMVLTSVALLLWLGAATSAALHPHRGLQDRLARTWVVRC